MILPSCWMLRVANSTPMVDFESRWNSLRVKRLNRFDLPTPESPMMTTALGRVSGERVGTGKRVRNTEAPQADAAGEASSDERLRKHTFEQVVVVIVRPRRRHRQPVFAVGNRFQAGQRRPDESAERMRQAGAMRSGARGLLLAWGGWLRTPPLRTQDSGRTVSVRHLALRRLLFAARSLARGEKNAPGLGSVTARLLGRCTCWTLVWMVVGASRFHGTRRGRNSQHAIS